MKFTYIALLGLVAINNVEAVQTTDFNGADEDEIMDKVFSKYSTEGKDHNGIKNGQKILMKMTAPKAAGVILEATHKLKGMQVPGYIKANFDKAWDRFDINADGFIKAEETHTFMRSLMGKLNKFALAPGSLSDIGAATPAASSVDVAAVAETPKPAKKASKLVQKKAVATEGDASMDASQADVAAIAADMSQADL